MQSGQTRLIGRLLMAGVVLLTALAMAATRILEPMPAPAFHWLIYVSAGGLVTLALAGGMLARALAAGSGPPGLVVAMALVEGTAMLGLVSAALSGQPAWAGGIGLLALVIMGRLLATVDEPGG